MSNNAIIKSWTFEPSSPNATVRLLRARSAFKGWAAPPPWKEIQPFTRAQRWNVFFAFCPDGRLTAQHRDSLSRIGRLTGQTGLVVASPSINDINESSLPSVDAIYWKGLSGFDFSAYALALRALIRLSPGCDLYLQNDSVLGPLENLESLIPSMEWRLSGFLASSAIENHLQSYALFFKDLQSDLLRDLYPALSISRSLDNWRDVVLLQETKLARVASRRHAVGSLWFDPSAKRADKTLSRTLLERIPRYRTSSVTTYDPSLVRAAEMLADGFPFAKRSLFSRNRSLIDANHLVELLCNRGMAPELLE